MVLAPGRIDPPGGDFRPTLTMESYSHKVQFNPDTISQSGNELRSIS